MSGLSELFNTDFRKTAVWQKGTPIAGLSPDEWRYDANWHKIRFSDYGNRSSEHGWEIDHYPVPTGLGGFDNLDNMRPLHWHSNASHGGALGGLLSLYSKIEIR